jgi:hypothetical protein
MRKIHILFLMALCFCAFTNKAMAWTGTGTAANPWQIGDGATNTASAVKAKLVDSTLTIEGAGINSSSFTIKVENSSVSDDYDSCRESEHFIFAIPSSFLFGNITSANLCRWMQHMDDVYDAYVDLIGHAPANGQKIIFSLREDGCGEFCAYIGGNDIFWNPIYVVENLKEINDYDSWNFGPMHELGHCFDKDPEPNWIWHAEMTANIKPIYALDVLPDCKYELGGYFYSLQDWYNSCYNWSMQDDGDDDRFGDKITLGIIKVVQQYGWNVFKQTFRSYWDNSYPNVGCNVGDAGKYNEFIDRLEYFSGSADIRNECFNTNNWLATIEQHYPRTFDCPYTSPPNYDYALPTPTTSWQTHSGSIVSGGCYVYRVSVTSGQKYTFKTGCGDGATADFDTELFLYDSSGNLLTWEDNGCESGRSKIEEYQFNYDGYAYIRVKGYGPLGGSTTFGSYMLAYQKTEISGTCTTPPDYDVDLSIPPIGGTHLYEQLVLFNGCIVYRMNVTSGKKYFAWSQSGYFNAETSLYNSSGILIPPVITGIDKSLEWISTYTGYAYVRIKESNNNSGSFTFHYGETLTSAINEIETVNFKIYPNPAKDLINISGITEFDNVQIWDLFGRMVETLRATSLQDGVQTIDISTLPKGIYLVKIYTDKGSVVNKIVKK